MKTLIIAILTDNPPSTTAGIVTACTAVIGAVTGLIVSLTVLVPMLRTVNKTHVIVNQQHTDAQRYIISLQQELVKNGIVIPIDQSLPVPGYPDAHPGQPK